MSDPDELSIDDLESASDENNTIVLDDGRLWVSFSKPCSVTKKTQEKEITKVSENGDNGILAGEKVSTDDAHQGGTHPVLMSVVNKICLIKKRVCQSLSEFQ